MTDDLIREGWLTPDGRAAVNGVPIQGELEQQLIARAADAIVFHPGNRAGDYELRRDVAREIARTVVKALRPELDKLTQLPLASEFRIPCINKTGGYAEVVVERDTVSKLWAVTDGSLTGRRAWHVDRWDYLSDIGREAAYCHELGPAIELAKEVADIEGRATDQWVAQHRAQLAKAGIALAESRSNEAVGE